MGERGLRIRSESDLGLWCEMGALPSIRLVLWAVAGVFTELAFVRLNSTLAGGVAYYGNLLLLVGIVALAAGMTAPRLARLSPAIPVGLLLPLWFAQWLSERNLIQHYEGEFIWSQVAMLYPKAVSFDLQFAIILLALAIMPALLLIGAGEARAFLEHRAGLRPYLLAAIGGASGAGLFLLQNRLAPSLLVLLVVWAALVAAPLLIENVQAPRRVVLVGLLLLFVSEGSVSASGHMWSPYQRIDTVERRDQQSVHVLANSFFIMRILTVKPDEVRPELRPAGAWVFDAGMRDGDRVLVLGSGGGTDDVREALHHGATAVTAVEIDRSFVELGLSYDPLRTYDDPRVQLVIGDARRYLGATDDRYDVILLPFLDSQTNASNHSRFRLDSFLYTREGLARAVDRLSDDGLFVLSFATGTDWIRKRLFDTLRAATDAEVRAYQVPGHMQTMFVVTKGARSLDNLGGGWVDVTEPLAGGPDFGVATDDWPFLYSRAREVPVEHLRLLLTLLLAMGVLLLAVRRPVLADAAAEPDQVALGHALRSYAFASGAGFFFIELRTISALAPVVGSSYDGQALVVMGVIGSSVVGALLAANSRALPRRWVWLTLGVTLALAVAAPGWLHPYSGTVLRSATWMTVALLLPTLVAGYLYVLYVRGRDSALVLSMQRSNYFGGAIGGLCEAVIVMTGFERSIFVAVGFYIAALGAAFAVERFARRADFSAAD